MFKEFDTYISPPESVTCDVDGFHCVATVYRDTDTQLPDGVPVEVMSSWANDEWFYCGVAVTVHKCGVQLTGDYDHALWGIDCNYPLGERSDKITNPNWYLSDVANDLLDPAIAAAKNKIAELTNTVVDIPA